MNSIQPWMLKDSPIENLRPLKVRVIGCGFSGIYLGIRVPQRLRNIDFQIFEKNSGLGGTWWENRYPGCACDIPSHSYQYSFNPNPTWSAFYAPAREICAYLSDTAEKYGVTRYVKMNHKVTSVKWDCSVKKWKLTVQKTHSGETFDDEADVVIQARGNLNDKAWPAIPGLNAFKGEVMHSSAWNERYDFRHKRIGIIGSGSSSIQIVPSLQKMDGALLTCFVRSRTWISNPFGEESMKKLGLDPRILEFSEEQIRLFESDPETYFRFRKTIEKDGNLVHGASLRDSDLQRHFRRIFTEMMKERLNKRPQIAEILTPSFAVGCRRLTPGPGYLEALVEENVNFIPDRIKCITAEGIELENGIEVPLDVLVCATGFNASAPPPFTVIGKSGVTMQERFSPSPETYLSVAVDGFPNYFMMLGPNSAIGSGSLTMILEQEGDYIVKCIRKLQKENYISMMPKPERVRDFTQYVDEYFKKTVYLDDCNSWYRSEGGKGTRIVGLWPGSTLHALEALRTPRWEDFDYETDEENKLSWLGNGWSVTQQEGGGDPAWYLETSEMDVPEVGKPENSARYLLRPFSN